MLDRALAHLAAVIHRDLGIDVRLMPGAGAAGGMGAGLVAFLGGRLRRGIDVVMEAAASERLDRADRSSRGRRFDGPSLRGKVPPGCSRPRARPACRPSSCAGEPRRAPEGVRIFSLVDRFGMERALSDARRALEDLATEVAEGLASAG